MCLFSSQPLLQIKWFNIDKPKKFFRIPLCLGNVLRWNNQRSMWMSRIMTIFLDLV